MKFGPLLAMLVVIGLSIWLVFGVTSGPRIAATPGATTFEMTVSRQKMVVEQMVTTQGGLERYEYRFLSGPRAGEEKLDERGFQAALAHMGASPPSRLLRFFNVSNYTNLLWVALGLGGQVVFSGRMIVQWFMSERRRESIVPPIFWYMSLAGGLCLMAYFLWRQDAIGVLGQSGGLVIYARNIRLMYVSRQRREDSPAVAVSDS